VLAERGLPEAPDVAAAGDEEPPLPPASTAQGSDAPITANEKLSYAERLSAATPANEPLKAAAPEPPAPATPAASTEPAGTGYAIQVAALRAQDEAEAIATRLAAKGYPAYVVVPARGAPSVYRVRVGKYQDRREADTVAARLTKEEQFKPWVVR
jgi:cell division septation protein DedD